MSEVSFDDVEKMINNFKSLTKSIHYLMIKKTEEIGISPDQAKLLLTIKNHQNINQNTLAKKLNVTKATLSVRLQRLQKLGYINKVQDEHDKRNYIISISEKGETFYNAATEIINEKTMAMFSGVSKEQMTAINEVIETVKENIKRCKGE